MHPLRGSVAALSLFGVGAAVGAAVALLWASNRAAECRDDVVRSAADAGRFCADDRVDLRAQIQDMVAEGGPAGA